jgi:uroporphyrinogen-III synthase
MNKPIRILNGRPLSHPYSTPTLESTWEQKLAGYGIDMFSLPLLDFIPEPSSGCVLGESPAAEFDGLFISSPRGFQFFRDSLGAHPEEWEAWLETPLYTLSQGVKRKAQDWGFSIGFCSEVKSLKGFVQELSHHKEFMGEAQSQKWMHPCSQKTRLNPKDFESLGIEVQNTSLYIPICPPISMGQFSKEWGHFQGCILSSGTAAEHFFLCIQRCKQELGIDYKEDLLDQVTFYSLGPSVTEVLQKYNISRIEEVEAGNVEGMYKRVLEMVGA